MASVLIEFIGYAILCGLAVATGLVAMMALAWAFTVALGLLMLPFALLGKAAKALRKGVTWIDPQSR